MSNSLGTQNFVLGNYTKLFYLVPAPIAIFMGKELRCVFVNDAYSQIFNSRKIDGEPIHDEFPELGGKPFYQSLQNVFDTGIPFTAYETPGKIEVDSNGIANTSFYNLVYTPYINNDGAVEAIICIGQDVSLSVIERKRVRDNQLIFRNIVEQSKDPILILKGKELILDVANNATLKLWNTTSESIGKPFLEILPEMKDQEFFELLLDVYNNGATHYGYETEAYFKKADGELEIHYFNFIYQPYLEADGNIGGVLVMATDVSEQVLTKRKLSQSETNFRNMVLQAPIAMCVLVSNNYVVEIANKHMYELWGKGTEEIAGKPIFTGLPEAKGQGLEELLDNVYKTGKRFIANEHAVQLGRNGRSETIYVNFVYEPLRNGDGSITGIIAVATEVTEQVLARNKISDAQEGARLAIESADLGTYEVDLVTDDLITSQRFNEIWGFSHSQSRSQFTSVIHVDDLPIRKQAHEIANETGNLHYEVRIHKGGMIRWVRVKGKILYDKQGVPLRLLGVIQDVTEQKLFAEELSKQVEERTKALVEVNDRLLRSNEKLEEFAYIASHDLQEPLRKIQLFNSLVLEEPEISQRARKYIEKVNTSAERMAGLIKDLLEYSQLSNKSLQFVPTNFNVIIQNILADFEVLIMQKNASITYSDLPVLEAIPLQVNQLFYNLIGNALKFSKRDIAPVIKIEGSTLQREMMVEFPRLDITKEYYQINISDNGIGFNQEYANKIFTIFQKLNEKSVYGGYGIGLALCQKIAENHSGLIYAAGTPKVGAVFSFIIPCKR